jgi:hypothetical protein
VRSRGAGTARGSGVGVVGRRMGPWRRRRMRRGGGERRRRTWRWRRRRGRRRGAKGLWRRGRRNRRRWGGCRWRGLRLRRFWFRLRFGRFRLRRLDWVLRMFDRGRRVRRRLDRRGGHGWSAYRSLCRKSAAQARAGPRAEQGEDHEGRQQDGNASPQPAAPLSAFRSAPSGGIGTMDPWHATTTMS